MSATVARPALIVADRWRDYQLLECGDGLKQERWGDVTLVRPDPQIIWPRHQREPGGSHPSHRFAAGSLHGALQLTGSVRTDVSPASERMSIKSLT